MEERGKMEERLRAGEEIVKESSKEFMKRRREGLGMYIFRVKEGK